MSQSKGDNISRGFFIAQLRHLFVSSEVDEQLRERVSIFLDSVDAFLKFLLDVRRLPEGEEFADDRVIATVSIIFVDHSHEILNCHLPATSDELHPRHWQGRDVHQICASVGQCEFF